MLIIYIKYVICMVFLIIANITDIKNYKVKNITVVPVIIIGLALNIVCHSFLDSVYGMLVPLILFPLYALRMMGAGDIKALCAVGTVVGLKLSVETMLLSFLAGGVLAMIFMLIRKNAIARLKTFWEYIKCCFWQKSLSGYDRFTEGSSLFRFTFGITGGFLLTILNSVFHVISI